MHISKNLFWFSLISSVILFIISTIIEIFSTSVIFKYIESIMLNVFAGTIVMVVTSFMDYQIQKKRNIICLQEKIIEIENMFMKIDYIEDIKEYPSYEYYSKYYENMEPPRTITKEQYNHNKLIDFTQKYKKAFEETIEEYINISTINLSEIWRLYDDLYFLWPLVGKDKKKIKIYNEILKYIDELVSTIKISAYHFKQYRKGLNTNYKPSYDILLDTQRKIFHYEKTYGYVTDWLNNHNKEFIKSNECNPFDDSNTLIYNIVAEYLENKWQELKKY